MQRLRAGFFRGLFRMTDAFIDLGTFTPATPPLRADPRRFFPTCVGHRQ